MIVGSDRILQLCARAVTEVVLVSPFIKSAALHRLLRSIPSTVEKISCITRWIPSDVALGVSDLYVFDQLSEIPNAELRIHPLLHAKYFRIDDACVIGSANLTDRGMGWAMPSNFEILFEVPTNSPGLRETELDLIRTSFKASKALKDQIAAEAERIETMKVAAYAGTPATGDAVVPPESWLPLCPRPELLYQIYSGRNLELIVGWTLEAGRSDLAALMIQDGLAHQQFKDAVAATLSVQPIVRKIHEQALQPISIEDGASIIIDVLGPEDLKYKAHDHWNILKRWLLHFLPLEYRQPSGSEDLQRGMFLGRL